jgi:hypothetical protein
MQTVWFGDFTDEDGFDDYVKSDVEAKLQLSPEAADIVELLTGFSHSVSFLAEAIVTAKQKWIASASSAWMHSIWFFVMPPTVGDHLDSLGASGRRNEAQLDHWAKRGQAATVSNCNATGRQRGSVLELAP